MKFFTEFVTKISHVEKWQEAHKYNFKGLRI